VRAGTPPCGAIRRVRDLTHRDDMAGSGAKFRVQPTSSRRGPAASGPSPRRGQADREPAGGTAGM